MSEESPAQAARRRLAATRGEPPPAKSVPVLPTHSPCRLRTLETLEAAFANDAANTAAQMLADGWDLSDDDERDFYKTWLLTRFADAIDFGWAWAQLDPGRPM